MLFISLIMTAGIGLAEGVIAGTYNIANANDVEVSGNHAYVAAYNNGLVIVDITDPSSPSLEATQNIGGGYAYDVAVSGDYAYIAAYNNGLVIVDITDPSSPKLVGSYHNARYAEDVTVLGDYAYVADREKGLIIVDVTNPSLPNLAGSYDTGDEAQSVAISGNYAYLIDWSGGLIIVDVTNPSSPKFVSSYPTGIAYDVVASDNYAYIADSGNGLLILDITIPSSPQFAGSYDTGQSYGRSKVTESGNYAYVSAGDWGLVIVDITNLSSPKLAGDYDDGAFVLDVDVSGDYVYVVNSNGLVILQTDILIQMPITVGQGASTPEITQKFVEACERNGGLSVLGNPTTEVHSAFEFEVQDFPELPATAGGVIMYNPNNKTAYFIHGAIWDRYYDYPEKAKLGAVASDEKVADASPQGTVGKYTEFESGCIHWISNKEGENVGHLQRGQSFVTYGYLNKMYDEMGGTGSELGFPIMDQEENDGYGYCKFEGGYIDWDDTARVYKVYYNSATSLSCEIIAPVEQGSFKKGESIVFSGKAEGGNPPYTYAWIIDGQGFSTMYSEYTPPAPSPGVHTVQLQVSDSLGDKAESATVHFAVYTKKVAVVPAKFLDSGTISNPNFGTLLERCNLIQQYYSSQSYGAEYIEFELHKSNAEDGWFEISNLASEFSDTFPILDTMRENYGNYPKRKSMWKEACGAAGINVVEDSSYYSGYKTEDYDTVLVLFPAGFRSEAYDTCVICSTQKWNGHEITYGTWAHELGHSLYGLNDKASDSSDGGNIGNWGIMGLGYRYNPPSPIIGFEKNQITEGIRVKTSWLPYKNISVSDIADSGNEYTISYLDDPTLHDEGLLRLSTKESTKFIFEARRKTDGVAKESSGESNPLFCSANKGIVIYNVDSNNKIWREASNKDLQNFLNINNDITMSPGESKKLNSNTLKVTCISAEDKVKLKIEPFYPIETKIWSITTNVVDNVASVFSVPDDSNPDVDLHVITSDGRHVGMDYINGTYYNEIEGAETSGNLLGGGPEWISMPANIDATAYVTISPDMETLLSDNDSFNVSVSSTFIVYDENGNMEKSEPVSINISSKDITDQFTIPLIKIDSLPSITNLQSINGTTWINWTWINPSDSDFNHTEIYLNNIFQTNTSAEYFNATGLEPETEYTISTRTVDISGNVNETWVNSTAATLKAPIIVEAGSDQTVEEGTSVNFEGSFTDSSSHTYSYHWNFGDGSEEDSSLITSHTYTDNGVYTVNLTVIDEESNFGNDTLLVTVNNAIPIVNAGSDLEVTAGDPVSFTSNFSDPGWLDTHTAEWNFGEGTLESGSVSEENEYPNSTGTVSGNFSYFDAGKYTVTLNVADDDGGIGQDQLTVTVRPIKAEVTFDPETFNLNSTGEWVTAYIELPAGYSVSGIDISSVLLNGTVHAVSDPKYDFVTNESEYMKDLDLDGISERMFKFNRAEVAGILKAGDQVTVTFTGKVEYNNGISSGMASFEGSDVIKVTKKDSKK
jgi:PKD repeat protein